MVLYSTYKYLLHTTPLPAMHRGYIYNLSVSLLLTRSAPTSCKLGYNPYKWPYKLVTGVITPISEVITLLITGRGPPCTWSQNSDVN